MKKYFTYGPILLLLISALFISCEDDLDVNPNKTISQADFLKNPDNAIQLVNGVYNKNLDYNMNSFSWVGITSITSDDADKGSTPGDSGTDKLLLDNLTFNSSCISFADVWEAKWQGIGRANTALFYLEQFTIDPTLKNRLIGEVEFLRALWYFDLVRCFGGVPIVVKQIDINDTESVNSIVYTRRSKAETYAQIETDLLDAISKLPLRSQYGNNDMGRATKGAAQTLLSKAYLYQEKWQQSFDMAGEVISSGQYALLADYANVWRLAGENGTESVFEIQANFTNGVNEYVNVQSPRGSPDLGWGFNTPSAGLASAYEPTDKRRAATILYSNTVLWDGFPASTTWTNPRYNYKAYESTIAEGRDLNKKNDSGKNLRVLKYSDVLLIRAEAGFHVGSGEALSRVNETRHRAGLGDLLSVTLADIWKERRLEMAMEHERWFDIVRTGQAPAAMLADGKTFIVGTHEVFPIPQNQILASGMRLAQNPGY